GPVGAMSPRLPSRTTSTARLRASEGSSSTAVMPALPKRSKNADCGLSSEIRKSAASSTRLPNSKAPAALSGRWQESSSAEDGSTPTRSGLGSTIFCCNRAANVDMSGYLFSEASLYCSVAGHSDAGRLKAVLAEREHQRISCTARSVVLNRRGLVND